MTTNKTQTGGQLMATTIKDTLHGIDGTTGCHYDLARYVECKGLEVEMDSDDNEVSLIAVPGSDDFDRRIVGRIIGDAEAKIVINTWEAKVDA